VSICPQAQAVCAQVRTHEAADDRAVRSCQLARLACGLHVASLLSCAAVQYLYLTTNKRRRTRTAKLLFCLSLCSAVLAIVTALTEWATAEACLGVQRCRREPTRGMALMESARILGLHTCGAWTGCIAVHLVRERLLSQGLADYDFPKTQRLYHLLGWGSPLVHMQLCIAMRSAAGPRAASATFVGFDILVAALVCVAFAHAALQALCCRSQHSSHGSTPDGARHVGGRGQLPGLSSRDRERGASGEIAASSLLALLPHLCSHGWKVFLFPSSFPDPWCRFRCMQFIFHM
jgi:hypothetical protein